MAELKISKADLLRASHGGVISAEQAEALWDALESRIPAANRFDLPHVAYYAGALLVISAMGWFLGEAWEALGGRGILAVALVYAALFSAAGGELWFRRGLKVPGGLLVTIAVCMTPVAIFGIQQLTGFWPEGNPGDFPDFALLATRNRILMEVGTILAGAVALRLVRFPFLTAPIAFALWYLSMDVSLLWMERESLTWDERRSVCLWFGLAMLVGSYFVDRRTREDYAFWGYLFGLMAFWTGISLASTSTDLERLGALLVNVVLMLLSVLLQRRAFVVFGAFGVFLHLAQFAHRTFAGSLAFPLVLSVIGVLIIYAGVQFQRHQERIEAAIVTSIPDAIRRYLPTGRNPRS